MSRRKKEKRDQKSIALENIRKYREFDEKYSKLKEECRLKDSDYKEYKLKDKKDTANKKEEKKKLRNKKREESRRRALDKITQSSAEIIISKVLREAKKSFITEFEFTDLVNPRTGNRLRFDFYIPKDNTCIEYDGKHHFMYVPAIHGPDEDKAGILLSQQQYRDNVKSKYCKENNIKLIRLNHKNYYNMKEALLAKLR